MNRTRFGKLRIVECLPGSKNKHRVAVCICDCGNSRMVRVTRLRTGKIFQCAACAMSEARESGRLTRRKVPVGESILRAVISDYRQNAKRKGIAFELPDKECIDLLKSACFYCGAKPQQFHRAKLGASSAFNGIDRKNNDIGYVSGNVVPCCRQCNYAKRDMTLEEFFAWVRRAYQHNDGRLHSSSKSSGLS